VSDLKLVVSSWGDVMVDKRELRKLMRAAGNDIKNKTSRLINQRNGGGRSYYGPQGRYTASTPGSAPSRVSNTLRASLRTYVFKSGEGFAVRAREFYALFLEVGASGGGPHGGKGREHRQLSRSVRAARARARGARREMEPRPFLDVVMAREARELDRRVGAALSGALTWKQTK
jgi:hypothetical protein